MEKTVNLDTVDQPISIEKGYEELSHSAFSVWIRLMMVNDDKLKSGRLRMAKLLGYSDSRSDCVLRELKNKGYLRLIPGPRNGTPTVVEIRRRASISGRNRFLKLSAIQEHKSAAR